MLALCLLFDEVILDQEWRSFEIWSRVRLCVWVWSKTNACNWNEGNELQRSTKTKSYKIGFNLFQKSFYKVLQLIVFKNQFVEHAIDRKKSINWFSL